jgi:molecular chaperone DnaJ
VLYYGNNKAMPKNYYDILGIQKSASKDDIKKAFRTLAHKYHPDKKGGDASKFKEISEAYGVLSDDKKRAEYDAYGRVFSEGAPGGAQGNPFGGFDFNGMNFENGENPFVNFDIGDIFGDFFGGGDRAPRGRDISIDIELSFEEAIFGLERKILITKTSACDTCNGNGGKRGVGDAPCVPCNGKGKIRETKRSFIGAFSTVRTCDTCNGRGTVPKEKCESCKGNGITRGQKEIAIAIPAGIDDGEVIRLTGAGEAVSGGKPGDLYARIHVKPHPLFKKDGSNLVMELSIKLSTALLGGEYIVRSLDGDITVKIPVGVAHGEVLRIRGKGVPVDRARRGDILIRIAIELPRKLSKTAVHLVEELKKEGI